MNITTKLIREQDGKVPSATIVVVDDIDVGLITQFGFAGNTNVFAIRKAGVRQMILDGVPVDATYLHWIDGEENTPMPACIDNIIRYHRVRNELWAYWPDDPGDYWFYGCLHGRVASAFYYAQVREASNGATVHIIQGDVRMPSEQHVRGWWLPIIMPEPPIGKERGL